MSSAHSHRLYGPLPADIRADRARPRAVGGVAVAAIREEWVVQDRWWTRSPLDRHYFELVLADGRCIVVYRDRRARSWFSQRG